jgi:hypothetical protein
VSAADTPALLPTEDAWRKRRQVAGRAAGGTPSATGRAAAAGIHDEPTSARTGCSPCRHAEREAREATAAAPEDGGASDDAAS